MSRQVIRLVAPILTASALSGCAGGVPSAGVGEPTAPVKLDVIFVTTDLTIVNAMLTLAGVTRDDVVYDLGCGDGRIVIAAAWDAANKTPPTLQGQLFHYSSSPNRYGIPAYYSLHVWAWRHNPTGVFGDWNPKVSCDGYSPESAR